MGGGLKKGDETGVGEETTRMDEAGSPENETDGGESSARERRRAEISREGERMCVRVSAQLSKWIND